jgi:hypothetical protein
MGRGWEKLLLLPFNITLRARVFAYDAFGFRLSRCTSSPPSPVAAPAAARLRRAV